MSAGRSVGSSKNAADASVSSVSIARCTLSVVPKGSATGSLSSQRPNGATSTIGPNASGRTAASSSASIAPTLEATSGAPARPATSTTSLVATTQSCRLRRPSGSLEPVKPGRLGATTRWPTAASSSSTACTPGLPSIPCR